MYRSLLVPLDGSATAEQALPFALAIARRAGASLQVVSVVPHTWNTPLFSKQASSQLIALWRSYLDRVVERVRSGTDVPVTAVILEGQSAAPQLAAHAASCGAVLIVMTTHGRGALGSFWCGSVTYELLQRSPISLLLTRPGASVAQVQNVADLNHFLIPLDGSPLAERIVEQAVAFGSLFDASYTLLRVVNVIPPATPELDSVSLSSAAVDVLGEIRIVQERLHKEAEMYLEGVGGRLRAQGYRVDTRVIVRADPSTAILDELAGPAIDLVAMETHGRRGLSGLVLGSVARKVICGSMKPIFVSR